MQEEKFTLLNISPCTLYDLYLRQLKAANSDIKQAGVPVEEERRDIEIGTDEIVMVDKELQVSCGDDTVLLNIMKVVQERKRNPRPAQKAANDQDSGPSGKSKSKKSQATGPVEESVLEAAGVRSLGPARADRSEVAADGGYSTKLASFLQRSSLVCETILEENSQRRSNSLKETSKAKDQGSLRPRSLFDSSGSWISFGNDSKSGANELIRSRPIIAARFSSLQPNLLLTAHPPPTGEALSEDLRPTKALFCVWDVHSPGSPSMVLECAGSPSCCSFSSLQPFVITAGTSEGAIALWDLREANSFHRDRSVR
jgi:hypothetical protein